MKIVGNDRNLDCLSIKILSFLYKVYILKTSTTKQISKQKKTKRKQKRERQKEKRKATEQDSNPAPCQKLYEHKVNVLKTTDKLFLSVFTIIC